MCLAHATMQPKSCVACAAEVALHRSAGWLGDANEAGARGDTKRAEVCMRKSQYWLDRHTNLSGDGPKRRR